MKRLFGIVFMFCLVCTLPIMIGCSENKAQKTMKDPEKSDISDKEDVVDLGKDVKMEMVLIPAGKFKMGSANEDIKKTITRDLDLKYIDEKVGDDFIERLSRQETCHEVILTNSYYIGKKEVTQEQWEAVIDGNPSIVKGAKLPVTHVSWNDCQDFIRKLNSRGKENYRLPTEAEWEYACRAGSATAYSYGNDLMQKDANFGGGESGSIKPVGMYKPNAFGLYDMHGNVWEWCGDWGGAYAPTEMTDPKGPITGEVRVLRGGSFLSYASFVRSSNRFYLIPTNRYAYAGFRIARTK